MRSPKRSSNESLNRSLRAPDSGLVIPGHPRWEEFVERLEGPAGIDVRGTSTRCSGSEDKPVSARILRAMGLRPAQVAANLRYFEAHGGYCDCEVWMNVDRDRADEEEDDAELWGEVW